MRYERSIIVLLLGVACPWACGQASSGSVGSGGSRATGGSAGGTSSSGASTASGGMGGSGGGGSPTGGSRPDSGGATGLAGGAHGGAMAGAGGTGKGTSDEGSGGTQPAAGGTSFAGSGGSDDAAATDAAVDARDVGQTGAKADGADDQRASGGAGGRADDGPLGEGGGGDSGGDARPKIKVWLAGDSTVMDCTGTCPCGWGSQFQGLLNANATVINSAVGGRSIQTWLYDPNVTTTMDANGECVVSPKTYSSRWQEMTDPAGGMKPGDYLFIEFGINDGDTTCNRHVGTALFQSYLATMAQAAKKLGAQPVFLTSTSYIACSGATAASNRGFVSETKAAGQANGVPVIDLTALSAALYTSLGLCPNAGDYTSTTSAVGKFFCDDHTHFEATGAVAIAKLVAQAVKDQGIGLAAYLR